MDQATLRLNAASYQAGHSLQAQQVTGAWTECGVHLGSQVRAIDPSGNVHQTPASSSRTVAVDCGWPVTMSAGRDAWIDQSRTSQNQAPAPCSRSARRAGTRWRGPSSASPFGGSVRVQRRPGHPPAPSETAVSRRTLQALPTADRELKRRMVSPGRTSLGAPGPQLRRRMGLAGGSGPSRQVQGDVRGRAPTTAS